MPNSGSAGRIVRGAAAAPPHRANGVSLVVASLARMSVGATVPAASVPCHPRLRHGKGKTIRHAGRSFRTTVALICGAFPVRGRATSSRAAGGLYGRRPSRPTRRSKSFQAKQIVRPLATTGWLAPTGGRSQFKTRHRSAPANSRNGTGRFWQLANLGWAPGFVSAEGPDCRSLEQDFQFRRTPRWHEL
jgi:hypothetical protein